MTSYDVLITSCLVNGGHLILDFHKTFGRMKVRKPRNRRLFYYSVGHLPVNFPKILVARISLEGVG